MLVCCRELYVCQGFPVISTMDCEHFIEAFMLSMEHVDGTLWIWVMNSRDVIPRVTSDWWTIYVCEFSVTRWTLSSRHLCCLRSESLNINYNYSWNILRHSSTIFLIGNLVNRHSSSLRSSCEDFYIKTTAQKLYCDRQHFESTSRNCITVNYNSQPLIILLLWHHITIRDYPPIPKHVIKHYNILSIAENWYFFITNTYPTCIFYHSNPILYRNCY